MLSNELFVKSSPSVELLLVLREPFRQTGMTTRDELTTLRDERGPKGKQCMSFLFYQRFDFSK